MSQLDVSELDFDTIKGNLKEFLSSQEEFSDYNFEGSALSVLLDVLAYNTHYNAMLAHMISNESFLDSAVKRSSVVSLAKAIGYTPRSRRAAEAVINLVVYPDSSFTDTILGLSRDTQFTATIDGTSYVFYPQEDQYTILRSIAGRDLFFFSGLRIKEGRRITNRFFVTADSLSGPFTIPNVGIDTTTLRVRVQKSGTDFSLETFSKKDKFTDVTNSSAVYFVEEGSDGNYQIRFGDGVIGKQLEAGNVVIVDYLNTQGAAANNAQTFSCATVLTNSSENLIVQVTSPSAGGAARETVDSIKVNAPRYNSTKERAVTAKDYESLILASNPNIQSVSVWGGEDNTPPIYGKVFISLNANTGSVVTQSTKDKIVSEIILPRTPIAIQPEFIDPEFTYVGLRLDVSYNTKTTTLTSGQLVNLVNGAVNNYFNDELNSLNKHLYYTDLHNEITSVSDSIVSISLNYRLQKRILLTELNALGSYKTTFNAKMQPRTIYTTWFDTIIARQSYKCKIVDVPNSGVVSPDYNGFGTLYLEGTDGKQLKEVGTIDYDTGEVELPDLEIVSLYGSETVLRLNGIPHEYVKDIKTDILTRTTPVTSSPVVPTPSKNTILILDNSTLNVTTGSRSGVEITTTARLREN